MQDAQYYIDQLGMTQHVEGGAFRETYRAQLILPPAALTVGHHGPRAASTAIYFLLQYGQFSGFHMLASDEMLHFYDGSPLQVYEITPAGKMLVHQLGRDLAQGQSFQCMIPGGSWFALRCEVEGGFALIGCTVAPAFDFADFHMDDRAALTAKFPQHAQLIREMTFERVPVGGSKI